jgi:glucose/arabinose dehydrogenase
MPRRRTVLIVSGACVSLAAVGAGAFFALRPDDDRPSPSRAAADRPCGRPYVEVLSPPPPSKPDLVLEPVGEIEQPTALVFDDVDAGDGLLASRTGEVYAVRGGRIDDEVVLDLSDDTIGEGDGGLLGLALDPDGGWLYAYRTTAQQDEEVTAYPLGADRLPDAGGERLVLAVDHPPSEQHHGGAFGFGPDDMLYLGLGDGGGLGDPGENGQDPSTLLGKVLRIDPTPGDDEPYRVPADNPFVERDGWRPEIWALGVRNPFRLSFDPETGDLWLADVGQTCWEELNRIPAGAGGLNLGWDVREGTEAFEGGPATGGDTTEPELAYAHRRGWCAIVVGPVQPDGDVLHTDYCKGRLMVLRPGAPGRAPRLADTGIRVQRPVAVVAGPGGEPWILSLEGGVFRVAT